MMFIHQISGLSVIIKPDLSGGFFAVVPALPGCGSQGESIDDALENLDDAIMTVLDVLREDDPVRLLRLCGRIVRSGVIDAEDVDSTWPVLIATENSSRL